jgi:outer membrane receptor for ferrienterochelin and colicin
LPSKKSSFRDGASAQYGSDADCGVININVKKATNKFDIAFATNFKGQMITEVVTMEIMLR